MKRNITAAVNEVRIVRDMHTDGDIPACLAKWDIKAMFIVANTMENALRVAKTLI